MTATNQIAECKVYAYLSSAWVELTPDTIGDISFKWGISRTGAIDRLAETGSMTFVLNNSTGKYAPGNASALTGWKKGASVKLEMTYDGQTYIRFRGQIDALRIEPSLARGRTVTVIVLDWLDYAAKYPLVSPGYQANKTADYSLGVLIPALPIQPQETSYDAGDNIFPAIFDTVTTKTKAYTELSKLALSEVGYIYLQKSKTSGEKLVFESNSHRNGLHQLTTIPVASNDPSYLLLEDSSYLLLEDSGKIVLDEVGTVLIDNTMRNIKISYGENLINRINAVAYPKYIDTTEKVLYSLPTALLIGPSQTITYRGNYTDPSGGAIINALSSTMIAPVKSSTDTYTKSLLHCNGANASTTFTDESGKTWTAHSTAKIDTALSWQGGASGLFNGTSDYIDTPSHTDFDFGSGDFTVDWWEYRTDATNAKCTITRDPLTYSAFNMGYSDGTNLVVYMSSNGTSWDIAAAKSLGVISLNQWVHLAVVRSGNTFYCFKNGIVTSTWTSSLALLTASTTMTIGKNIGVFFTGRIDEFRVCKGIARWTAAFTPQSVQYTYTFAIGGDYSMNTAADSSGTDITSDLALSVVYGTEGATYTLTNNSIYAGYITKLQARGYGIYQYNPTETTREDAPSYNEYGYKNETLQQQYQRELTAGGTEIEKILEREKQPRTTLDKVELVANKSASLMMAMLNIDVGDLVHIKETQSGSDGYYYIQGVEITVTPDKAIFYNWTLRQSFSLQSGYSLIAADMNSATPYKDMLNFGYQPRLSNLTSFTYCAWINPTYDFGYIMSIFSDASGKALGLAGYKLNLYQKASISPGNWQTAAGTISLNTWTFVAVTRDASISTNQPIFYKNGSVISCTQTSTLSGTVNDETGDIFSIGNIKTATKDYDGNFDGKIKDARVYNRILSAAEIATIYAEGAGGSAVTSGLVFQGPVVRTGDLAYFTDHTMLSTDRVIDNIYGAIGTPHGNPITRLT